MTDDEGAHRRRLQRMAREADALQGKLDQKLQKVAQIVKQLIGDGFSPILFCRFIPTAEYVAEGATFPDDVCPRDHQGR